MTKKFCCFVVLLFCSFVSAPQASAAGEFTADYDVNYAIAQSGTTIVTHVVSLTNKLTNLYAREYSIVFDSTKIGNIIAYDDGGQILPEIIQTDGKTEIKLRFNSQVTGVGNTLTFSLRFENEEIAQKIGSIWEVHLPGIASDADLGEYFATLNVPPSFGPVAYMSPPPASGGRWNRDQMTRGGVSVAYGTKQQFLLDLSYYIKNDALTGKVVEVALPPDTAYQKVTIAKVSPSPFEIVRDADGNWLARYMLKPGQKQDISARMYVAITLDPKPGWTTRGEMDLYTRPQQYWESTDPAILSQASQLEGVAEIFQFVVDTLSYDYTRVNQNPIRKGARAALSSPTRSICMEFTDLFIALARARGIPAREVLGFAYTTNTKLRPLSLVTDVLHSWPEYYDSKKEQWIPVDPTWADTTGGIDYFNKLDFNHIVFAIRGTRSDYPYPAGFYRRPDKSTRDVEVTFAATIPESSSTTTTSIEFPTSIIAGFESKGTVRVVNIGSTSIDKLDIAVQSTPTDVAIFESVEGMPPFSSRIYPFTLTAPDFFKGGGGKITATVNGATHMHQFTIAPSYILLLPTGILLGLAVSVLLLFRKKKKNSPYEHKPIRSSQ